ncbi:hypothetical protein C1H76_0989 [Elsinoe australis]|uniref:Glutamine amidotransferase type-2 domain-containing protein n=1 Tax=Elsinoe australis TaxID=40998 RepID=A0A4U7BE22_9PEZI|nr:hypothetical protein C1H76_0989 [Elsinoe australis]
MCRWIAYISPTEPCLLSDVLITPAHALTKQVNTYYLPYLIPHHLAPIDLVESISQPSPPTPTSPPADLLLTSAPIPPIHLVPPTTTPPSPNALARHALKLRNLALNTDGHGLVYFRSPLPLSSSSNFLSLASNTSTTCLLAHVRAGSGAPVSELNCHPFVFGRLSIMHNGSVGSFSKIKRQLLDRLSQKVYDQIQGGTDSEVVAALIVQEIGLEGDLERVDCGVRVLAAAVVAVFQAVLETQKEVLGRTEASSLNVCVTDGRVLVATRFRNSGEEPPSLYWSVSAGVTLNSKHPGHPDEVGTGGNKEREHGMWKKAEGEHAPHVIVASEPSTFNEEEWMLMGKNSILMVDKEGVVETRDIAERDGTLGIE